VQFGDHCRRPAEYGYKFPKGRYDPGPTAYKTKDGEWIQTSILEYDRYFPALCRVLGVPEMAEDPRFKTQKASLQPENKRYQIELFEKIYATRTAEEWIRALGAEDIVVDRLAHFKELPEDEQALQNGFMTPLTMPGGETCFISRPSPRFDSMEVPPVSCASLLGADTAAVLEELGLSREEITGSQTTALSRSENSPRTKNIRRTIP
jgi:crotonobetainyl-CoA:carnitine CoA-transferase CaiB-like acyl-CoA transferase